MCIKLCICDVDRRAALHGRHILEDQLVRNGVETPDGLYHFQEIAYQTVDNTRDRTWVSGEMYHGVWYMVFIREKFEFQPVWWSQSKTIRSRPDHVSWSRATYTEEWAQRNHICSYQFWIKSKIKSWVVCSMCGGMHMVWGSSVGGPKHFASWGVKFRKLQTNMILLR